MVRSLLVAALCCLLGACSGDPSPGAPPTGPPSPPGADAATPLTGRALGLRPGWGPTEAELDRAARLVGRLSLPELAGQVIVARYTGRRPPVRLVRRLHLGGVVVFEDNVAGSEQIRRSNADLRSGVGRPWPLFVGVDQEGGLVTRVRGGTTRFPAFMSSGAAGRPVLTRAAAHASAAQLRRLGFTVDLAPDADVTSRPGDPTIGSRSAGSDPQVVAEQSRAAARGILDAGLVPVLKHFPGHGSVGTDSHLGLPVQRRSLSELRRTDLVPFQAGVSAGLPAVMVAHLDLRRVDRGVPSSLSRRVVTGLLRRELGFRGLVLSDSLDMGAIRATMPPRRAAVAALRAGADVVLTPPDPAAARAQIVGAVRSGRLPRRRLEQAAVRQVALLLHQDRLRPGPAPSGPAASAALSRAALTSVAGPCRGRLVGRSVRPLGDPTVVAAFRAAAAGKLRLGRKGTRVALLGRESRRVRRPAVVVATDTPYVLGRGKAPVRLATYGSTPGAMAALVDVLLGRRRAPGRLPVDVPGVRRGCPRA